jgi:hypothetical protein
VQRQDRGAFLAIAAAALAAQIGAALVVVGNDFGLTGPPRAPAAWAAAAPVPAGGAAAQAGAAGSAGAAAGPSGGAVPVSAPVSAAVAAAGGVAPLGYSVPVRLKLERLGIDTDLMTLGMAPDRSVEVPPDDPDGPAGWYHGNPSPGETGTAVILGHVDAHGGRAVFYPLGLTRAGDKVLVRRADGRTAEFVVDRVASYPREEYGSADRPVLRLVTCGGEYDSRAGGYQENVVVFATLAATW